MEKEAKELLQTMLGGDDREDWFVGENGVSVEGDILVVSDEEKGEERRYRVSIERV